MNATGTPVYTRTHKGGLTLSQQSAVDLLASGKTDTETAQLLNLCRSSVSKWRLYSPVFQAALNQRRTEVWGAGIDELRALVLEALNVLGEELGNKESPQRLKAASEILRLAQLPGGGRCIGSTDADEIVRGMVEKRRERMLQDEEDQEFEGELDPDLPSFEEQVGEVWEELEALLAEAGTERK